MWRTSWCTSWWGVADVAVLRRLCFPALIALALAGCEDAADSASPASTSASVHIEDSAGVRIVEYAGTPEVRALALADEPVYTHGTGPDDYPFASIAGSVLYPDGSAAVFDWRNREIVLLGPDGTFRDVLGGTGEGPGEVSQYGNIRLTGRGGDTLLVEDDWHYRLTLFAGGEVAWTGRPPMGDAVAGLTATGIDGSGRVLMASILKPTAPDNFRAFEEPWRPGHLVRYDPPTQRADTIARYDWLESSDNESLGAMDHSGEVGVAGGEFVYGRTDIPQLAWRRADGTVRQIMRWQPDWILTSEENWEPFITCMRTYLHTLLGPSATEERIEENWARWDYDPAGTYPLFDRMHSDDEGRLWLENRWQPACYPRRLTAIGPDGTWLATFEPPEDFLLLDIAGGRVLGRVTDEMDVQSVVVFNLVGW